MPVILRLLHTIYLYIYFRVTEYCTTSEVLAYQNAELVSFFFLYDLMALLNKDSDNVFTDPSEFTMLPSQLNALVS